jgi:hypothetical protein
MRFSGGVAQRVSRLRIVFDLVRLEAAKCSLSVFASSLDSRVGRVCSLRRRRDIRRVRSCSADWAASDCGSRGRPISGSPVRAKLLETAEDVTNGRGSHLSAQHRHLAVSAALPVGRLQQLSGRRNGGDDERGEVADLSEASMRRGVQLSDESAHQAVLPLDAPCERVCDLEESES